MDAPEMLRELGEVLGDPDFERDPLGMLRAWAEVAAGAVDPNARYHLVDGGGHGAATLTELESVALALATYHGAIRNRDLRQRAPQLSAETIRRTLCGLCDRGLLRRVGHNSGTRYALPGGAP